MYRFSVWFFIFEKKQRHRLIFSFFLHPSKIKTPCHRIFQSRGRCRSRHHRSAWVMSIVTNQDTSRHPAQVKRRRHHWWRPRNTEILISLLVMHTVRLVPKKTSYVGMNLCRLFSMTLTLMVNKTRFNKACPSQITSSPPFFILNLD